MLLFEINGSVMLNANIFITTDGVNRELFNFFISTTYLLTCITVKGGPLGRMTRQFLKALELFSP